MKGVFFIEKYIGQRIKEHKEDEGMANADSLIAYFLNLSRKEGSDLYSGIFILHEVNQPIMNHDLNGFNTVS